MNISELRKTLNASLLAGDSYRQFQQRLLAMLATAQPVQHPHAKTFCVKA